MHILLYYDYLSMLIHIFFFRQLYTLVIDIVKMYSFIVVLATYVTYNNALVSIALHTDFTMQLFNKIAMLTKEALDVLSRREAQ